MAFDDASVQPVADTALPVREAISGLGHAVELRVYRSGGVLNLDWWYDTRRVERSNLESLAKQLPAALMEVVNDAGADDDDDLASDEIVFIDLSASDIGSELNA